MPEGATNAPPLTYVYAKGALHKEDGSIETWQLKDPKTPDIVGTLVVDTKFGGDVSSQRLFAKGFDQTPREFSFLQVAAPIFLLILTRLKMPVSTTFLLLTSFSVSAKSVGKVMMKSFTGYMLAFLIAMLVWVVLSPYSRRKKNPP